MKPSATPCRAHVNLEHPTMGEFCRALRNGRCRRGVVRWAKRYFKGPECEARPMPRTRPAAALPKCYRFNQVCGIDTMEVRNPLDRENPIRISDVIGHGTRYHQGARKQDMTAIETFSTLRQFWLKHYGSLEAPTTEAEVNELIDFTFAELKSTRGTCWIFAWPARFWTTTSTSVKFARRRFH